MSEEKPDIPPVGRMQVAGVALEYGLEQARRLQSELWTARREDLERWVANVIAALEAATESVDVPPKMDEHGELIARLYECRRMVGNMCSEGRPPKMSIPARVDVDEDIVICRTISEAIVALGGTVEPHPGQDGQPKVGDPQ